MGAATSPAFAGREAEIAEIRSAWESTAAGTGNLVLVTGEAGIGKSRLIEEALVGLDPSTPILRGGGWGGGGGAPFWPWWGILEDLLQRSGAGDSAERALVAQLAGGGTGDDAISGDEAGRRFRSFRAADAVLAGAAAEGALVVVLDDLHWADPGSLLLLEFLTTQGRAAQGPVLFVAAWRVGSSPSDEPPSEVARLARVPRARRLALGPLTADEVGQLIRSVTEHEAAPGVAERLQSQAGGSPLILCEALRMLPASTPISAEALANLSLRDGLLPLYLAQLRRLSARGRDALNACAVAGATAYSVFVGEMLGLSGADALDALDEAESEGLLLPGGRPGAYQFRHAILREVVLSAIPRGERARLHLVAGELLARRQSDRDLAALLRHFTEAAPIGGADRAVHYALALARSARSQFAYETAREAASTGLAIREDLPGPATEEAELWLLRADAERRTGDSEAALESYGRAAALARGEIEAGNSIAAHLLAEAAIGNARVRPGFPSAHAGELLREAIEVAEHTGLEGPIVPTLQAEHAANLFLSGDYEPAEFAAERALVLARLIGDRDALARAIAAAFTVFASPERYAERLDLADEMLRLGHSWSDPEIQLLAYRWQVSARLEQGSWAAVKQPLEAHAALAPRVHQHIDAWHIARWSAMDAIREGRWVDAERFAFEAMAAAQRAAISTPLLFFAPVLYQIRREQGRLAELESIMSAGPGAGQVSAAWRAGTALLYAECGRRADAEVEIEYFARDGFASLPRDSTWAICAFTLGDAIVALGHAAMAKALYARVEPFAGRALTMVDGTVYLGQVSSLLGRLAAVFGDLAAAEAWFRRALDEARRAESEPELAHIRFGLATVVQDGDPAEAAALRKAARETAERLGMVRLLTLLDQTPQPAVPSGLSAREIEVISLLAAGCTNAEIARELVISLHTVVRHVNNIYTKIGLRNRVDAGRWGVSHGFVAERGGRERGPR